MTDWHPDEDLLLDLALSDLDQQQRDALTGHLALCDPCRADFAAITDSVDHVLAAAPRVAPPAGFSRSVLAAMGMPDHGSRTPIDDQTLGQVVDLPGTVHRLRRDRACDCGGTPQSPCPAISLVQDYLSAGGPRPSGRVTVLTPAPLVRLIAAGWRPALHPSAAPHSSV